MVQNIKNCLNKSVKSTWFQKNVDGMIAKHLKGKINTY